MGVGGFFLEGKPGLEANFAFDQMLGARERFQGVLNAKRAETGLEPLAFEPPDRISTGGVILGNIGSLFGGDPPRQEPFARTFTLDQIDQAFDDAGFHPDEFQGLREAMSVEDILALQFRRPLSYLGSGQRQGAESGSDATRTRIGREVRGLPEEPLLDEINKTGPGDAITTTDPLTGNTTLRFRNRFGPIKVGPGDALFLPQDDGSVLLTDALEIPETMLTGNVTVVNPDGTETTTAMSNEEFLRRFTEGPLGSIRWAPIKEETTSFVGVEPTVKKTIELQLTSLLAEQANLSMLDSMLNPEWLSTWGRLETTFLQWGGNLKLLDSEQKLEYGRRVIAIANAAALLNNTIRRITGAQMSEREATRIRREVVDFENDNGVAFVAKKEWAMFFNALAVARGQMILQRGLGPTLTSSRGWDEIYSLEGMRQFLLDKTQDMYQVLLDQKFPVKQATNMASESIREQFGVDPRMITDGYLEKNVHGAIEMMHSFPTGNLDPDRRTPGMPSVPQTSAEQQLPTEISVPVRSPVAPEAPAQGGLPEVDLPQVDLPQATPTPQAAVEIEPVTQPGPPAPPITPDLVQP